MSYAGYYTTLMYTETHSINIGVVYRLHNTGLDKFNVTHQARRCTPVFHRGALYNQGPSGLPTFLKGLEQPSQETLLSFIHLPSVSTFCSLVLEPIDSTFRLHFISRTLQSFTICTFYFSYTAYFDFPSWNCSVESKIFTYP